MISHISIFASTTVQRFNGSTPNLVEHSTETSPCRARRSWLCLRERPGDPGGRSLHRQPHVAPRPEFGPLSMKPLPCSTWLGCCPKKVEKKNRKFQCNSVLCDFSAHFWAYRAYLKFLHLKWSTSILQMTWGCNLSWVTTIWTADWIHRWKWVEGYSS